MSLCTAKCRTCRFSSELDSTSLCCLYSVIAGTSRGCPAGDECTQYQKGPRIAVDGRESTETEKKVCYLAKADNSDYHIARILKIPQNRVRIYREANNIPEPLAFKTNGNNAPFIGRKKLQQMAEEGLTGEEMAKEYRVGKYRINKIKHNFKGEQNG